VHQDEEFHYRSPYVWRVIPLGPAAARTALMHLSDRYGSPLSGRRPKWKTCRGRSCLVLDADTTPAPRAAYWWVERLAGTVHIRCLSQRIELELLPWSPSRTELALRPAKGRLGFRLAGQDDTYFKAAINLLDEVEQALVESSPSAAA
jgi:hypothetical protein